ncbi:uncharacterized protein LAESUDRAFT_310757 [Laetiporus sulphureus 93-53]|uniref:Uncharacterized protein n=1 Tax=Laetiporus sulphureus 93-53 TaxID=1314785 RepID=A0A165D4B2_9APHY|nr:uncharacterized protein LAESUDRAFT_310757 [Laetiporus sulphureus 93-53]KZT04129.1 hypothetical protein LAESUDRAFT_310757 [Laetiporus sulphureus 93-53]
MASFFESICMCCFRSRSRSPDGQRQSETNERTHLIPETIEESPVSTYVVDQQQMDARLRTIVRAKEGKMVSVNAPLPFNLANHSVLALSQSASRSASLPPSTSCPHRFSSTSHSPPPHQRHFSPSRSSSSLRLPDSSLASPEHEHAGGNGEHKPAFNARIVRPPGTSAWMMRGRSVMRGRVGRSENSAEVSGQEG